MSIPANDWDESARDANLRWVSEILDGFEDGFCAFEFDWRITQANRAAEAYMGVTLEQVFGATYWEIVPQAVGTDLETLLRKAMAERLSLKIELPSALKPGRHVTFRAFPLPGGLGLSFRDVTERHQRIQRERDQAAHLQLALAASGMGDWIWHAATNELVFSDRAAVVFGVPADTPIGWREVRVLIHPDDREWVTGEIARAFDERTQYAVEMRVRPANGALEVWVIARGHVQFDLTGQAASMIGVIGDITASRAHEARLRESEARFRIMADGAPVIVWVSTASGSMEFANQAFADFAGMDRDALLGQGWTALLHPDDLVPVNEMRLKALATPETYTFEARCRRADGEWRRMLVMASPRFDGDAVFQGYVGIANDITETRQAEDRQQLLINELNHRVKNTLATVQSLAEQTSRQALNTTEFKDNFLARLMALSAAHSRLTQSNWGWTSLTDLAEDQLRMHGADHRLSARGPQVLLPPNMALSLSLALHELATNAAKYGALSCADGEAVFEWSCTEGADVELCWSETGGPVVVKPAQRGFGSRLLELVGRELGGKAHLDFAPRGLVWTARFPTPAAEEQDPP